ncbi:hypothetical protein PybrP1_002396 [[Pythium] brassicae (nom. inval.)]|nr:hypothetical protein PybrP1_002396 [[Pythium] brassicae (nom. inval.)]
MSQSPYRMSSEMPRASPGTPPDAPAAVAAMAVKGNKETRASEALAMKDEQLRILGEQNTQLLRSLNAMDDEIGALQQRRLVLEDEGRALRDHNFELQSKARAAEAGLAKAQAGAEERDTQIRVLTDHNTELLRLLEHEEGQAAALGAQRAALRGELDALQGRYASLLAAAKTHEEVAARASREGQLRAEEVRLLRTESDQLRACNAELRMKTQVELEALQEQLRVRKEKQYQLLEHVQRLEEAKRLGDDQLGALEDKLRRLHERGQELETQLQLEAKAKRAQVDANKSFFLENGNLLKDKAELQQRFERAEQERTRMEAENRDSAEQLREMAEKVFQLLERLKLAELGKAKALDGLKLKELELLGLKKKNSRLLKEGTQEGKARVKSELDRKVLLEQLQALKKHNAQLSVRCGEEVKAKLREAEERKALDDKLRTMSGRLAFLLNKMQADEEAKLAAKEDAKKMVAQIASLQEKSAEAAHKLFATAESNRVVTEALRCKQDELDAQRIRMDALQHKVGELAAALETSGLASSAFDHDNQDEARRGGGGGGGGGGEPHPDDAADALNSRFFVEARAAHGGLLVIKAKRQPAAPQAQQQAVAFLERLRVNAFLKRAQKSLNTKQMLVERLAALLATALAGEDAVEDAKQQVAAKRDQVAHLARKAKLLQEKLTAEEDAKRKTLLRYVHEIKSRAALAQQQQQLAGGASSDSSTDHGVLKLPESGVGDEEVHAIAALLRNAPNVKELQLRGNAVTSEGARAVAAILGLAGCQLRHVDLRANRITKDGVRVLAEALERNARTKHVYVHAGGKIEALGTTSAAASALHLNAQAMSSGVGATTSSGLIGVETICVVDVREQTSPESEPSLLDDVDFVGDDADAALSFAPPSALGAISGPGSAFKLKMAGVGAGTGAGESSALSSAGKDGGSARLFSRRPLSAAALKRHKEKLQQQRKKKLEDTRRHARKEAEWNGRAGGFDAPPAGSSSGGVPLAATPLSKKLPPITNGTAAGASAEPRRSPKAVSRTNSAPVLKKKTDDPQSGSER